MNDLSIKLQNFDRAFIQRMHVWGIPALRIALGIVFLWFGSLKLFGASPVVDLIAKTYYFLPTNAFLMVLGVWEVLIGIGLLLKLSLRVTLGLLWLQMAGTLLAPVFAPEMFFQSGNLLLLTVEGEFVIKNLVLIVAGIVIGGHEVAPNNQNQIS
jgi:uncharacterized membrane protein YkgB